MTHEQAAILGILAATVAMFVWGRWRHDMVAVGALLACVVAGLVPAAGAFAGFGHPAVVTVACVLILSHTLQQSGAIDMLSRVALPRSSGRTVTVAALAGLAAVLSAFMNNVGALALLMPVAIQLASRQGVPPGKMLMPLAFGSILGGMTTLIGTPPNLIVAGFRAQAGSGGFGMFDFTPVGLAVAAVGLVFVVLFSRWLVPTRARADTEGFDTGAYLTEARVVEKSKAVGMTLREVEEALEKADAQVTGLVRNEVRINAPSYNRTVRQNDILVVEADPENLAAALSSLGLRLEEEEDAREKAEAAAEEAAAEEAAGEEAAGEEAAGEEAADEEERVVTGEKPRAAAAVARGGEATSAVPGAGAADSGPADSGSEESGSAESGAAKTGTSDEIVLNELAVMPGSSLVGRSATGIRLRTRYGIVLLAVSRQGRRSTARLRRMPIRAGDVLLMQGSPEALTDFAYQFNCVPLAERALRIPDPRRALTAGLVMAAAVGVAALGLVPAAISFAGGVLAAMALNAVSLRRVYTAVDWPVVVLLGALIPVAGAMESTGAANLLAGLMLQYVAQGHAVVVLALILVVTMTLSDVMNNAATAAVMCPIAFGTAGQLGVSADPLLMAVAVGASCAFLTPIGHQNNTLILGPGGFAFGDYWRLGLPLEVIIVAVAVPMIMLVWPL